MLGEVRARARAELEQHALGLGQAEDRLHRVVDGVDEAGRGLRVLLDPDVEPDRAVEGRLLLDEQVGQLVRRSSGGRRRSRSSPAPRPSRGSCPPRARSGRARCSRAPASRAARGSTCEATMLVAVWLQVVGTSMPCCSKTGWPRLVVDDGGAQLPGHLVVGMPSRFREVPPESQARAFLDRRQRRAGLGSRVLHGMGRHQCYLTSGRRDGPRMTLSGGCRGPLLVHRRVGFVESS